MCRSLCSEKPTKCHRAFPPSHVVRAGGGPVSRATGVSFFASGPFPTCCQMSRSSTAEASKSSSRGAATGAANVRKPNTAERAGRFSSVDRQTSCLLLDLVKENINSVVSKPGFYSLSSISPIYFHRLPLQLMEACLIHILLSGTFQKFA